MLTGSVQLLIPKPDEAKAIGKRRDEADKKGGWSAAADMRTTGIRHTAVSSIQKTITRSSFGDAVEKLM